MKNISQLLSPFSPSISQKKKTWWPQLKSSLKKFTLHNDDFSQNREKLKEDILFFYSKKIPVILEVLYETARFEKGIWDLEPLFESPF
jgi:hypothetical protein